MSINGGSVDMFLRYVDAVDMFLKRVQKTLIHDILEDIEGRMVGHTPIQDLIEENLLLNNGGYRPKNSELSLVWIPFTRAGRAS